MAVKDIKIYMYTQNPFLEFGGFITYKSTSKFFTFSGDKSYYPGGWALFHYRSHSFRLSDAGSCIASSL